MPSDSQSSAHGFSHRSRPSYRRTSDRARKRLASWWRSRGRECPRRMNCFQNLLKSQSSPLQWSRSIQRFSQLLRLETLSGKSVAWDLKWHRKVCHQDTYRSILLSWPYGPRTAYGGPCSFGRRSFWGTSHTRGSLGPGGGTVRLSSRQTCCNSSSKQLLCARSCKSLRSLQSDVLQPTCWLEFLCL